MRRAEVGLIGGTGLESLLERAERVNVGTPYGLPSALLLGEVDERGVAFIPRHGLHHTIPPHRINYRANIYALHRLGVRRVIATNAVGAINPNYRPGDLVVPHDFIDFTKLRRLTFYDGAPVTHIDLSQPYCPEIRSLLIDAAKKQQAVRVWDRSVLVCTEGPRFETPAEIEMFRRLGCDIVGMTGVPEAVLARELEMCYATLCFVSNMAAGMQRRLTAHEVVETAEKCMPVIRRILREVVTRLPQERRCPCARALRDARLR